jgi:hypothetical protein
VRFADLSCNGGELVHQALLPQRTIRQDLGAGFLSKNFWPEFLLKIVRQDTDGIAR